MLQFRRNYITCDVINDLEIYENEYELSHIVFSYGLTDPESIETIIHPDFEDVIHLNLFTSLEHFEPQEKDIKQIDFWMNVSTIK